MPLKGRFRVYQDQQDPRDIHFETLRESDAGPVPQEQLELKDDVEQALTVIRGIFPDSDERFKGYFRQLLSLAQAGLVGDHADPAVAKQALRTLTNDILVNEGGRIKNRYMKTLGIWALVVGGPALLVGSLISQFLPAYTMASNFLALWSGCAAGVWLSFGARKPTLSFENLAVLEEDRLEPVVRLVFAGLLTIFAGLSFSVGALVLSVGNVSTAQINESFRVSLLLGAAFGLSERMLSSKMTDFASSFLQFGK